MNLVKSEIKWELFHMPYGFLEECEHAIQKAYFMEAEHKDLIKLDDLRESPWVEEDVKMPIVSYLAFSDREYYKIMDYDESISFVNEYDEAFYNIEKDIITMVDTKRLFLHIRDDKFIHIPCVQVW